MMFRGRRSSAPGRRRPLVKRSAGGTGLMVTGSAAEVRRRQLDGGDEPAAVGEPLAHAEDASQPAGERPVDDVLERIRAFRADLRRTMSLATVHFLDKTSARQNDDDVVIVERFAADEETDVNAEQFTVVAVENGPEGERTDVCTDDLDDNSGRSADGEISDHYDQDSISSDRDQRRSYGDVGHVSDVVDDDVDADPSMPYEDDHSAHELADEHDADDHAMHDLNDDAVHDRDDRDDAAGPYTEAVVQNGLHVNGEGEDTIERRGPDSVDEAESGESELNGIEDGGADDHIGIDCVWGNAVHCGEVADECAPSNVGCNGRRSRDGEDTVSSETGEPSNEGTERELVSAPASCSDDDSCPTARSSFHMVPDVAPDVRDTASSPRRPSPDTTVDVPHELCDRASSPVPFIVASVATMTDPRPATTVDCSTLTDPPRTRSYWTATDDVRTCTAATMTDEAAAVRMADTSTMTTGPEVPPTTSSSSSTMTDTVPARRLASTSTSTGDDLRSGTTSAATMTTPAAMTNACTVTPPVWTSDVGTHVDSSMLLLLSDERCRPVNNADSDERDVGADDRWQRIHADLESAMARLSNGFGSAFPAEHHDVSASSPAATVYAMERDGSPPGRWDPRGAPAPARPVETHHHYYYCNHVPAGATRPPTWRDDGPPVPVTRLVEYRPKAAHELVGKVLQRHRFDENDVGQNGSRLDLSGHRQRRQVDDVAALRLQREQLLKRYHQGTFQ
ncbi:Uncharacterized protein PBTT_04039 [Plasmodiophora brassicae]